MVEFEGVTAIEFESATTNVRVVEFRPLEDEWVSVAQKILRRRIKGQAANDVMGMAVLNDAVTMKTVINQPFTYVLLRFEKSGVISAGVAKRATYGPMEDVNNYARAVGIAFSRAIENAIPELWRWTNEKEQEEERFLTAK